MKDSGALREVSLLYRAVVRGVEGQESEASMERDAASGRFRACIPPQPAGTLVRYRIRAVNEAGGRLLYPSENDLRPSLSTYVHEAWDLGKIPLGLIIHTGTEWPAAAGEAGEPSADTRGGPFRGRRRGRGPGPGFFGPGGPFGERPGSGQRPERGSTAFIYVDPKTGKSTVFDHLTVNERHGGRGFRVHFHKDHTLDGMSAVNVVHEGSERFLLAEAFAYEVYRRAGSPAPLAELVRLSVDGRELGHHLMIERINRSYLRRNKVDDAGNLYKLLWFGGDIVGQHEKRTNTSSGHEDLLALAERLRAEGAEQQWKVIQESFNVGQVATYFAVNTVLSHWDGFFNNYFTYHDTAGTGKWEMYPWDQDKTSGYYDGVGEGEVFFDMPLTFGMDGAAPPSVRRDGRDRGPRHGFGGPFGGGASWWRPPGHFSGPLLANPHFRKAFLTRTRDVLETVFTQEACSPVLDAMAERLRDETARAARARGQDPGAAVRRLEDDVDSLREHLLKRRRFLLEQEEIRSLKA